MTSGRKLQIATVAGFALLALLPVADRMPFPFGVSSITAPTLVDFAAPPVALAAGAVGLVQVAAHLAGRGRDAPGARWVPFIRPLVLGFLLAIEGAWISSNAHFGVSLWGGPDWGWASYEDFLRGFGSALLAPVVLTATAIVVADAGGGSVVTPVALIAIVARMRHMPEDYHLSAAVALLAPIAMGLAWLARLRPDRESLARRGITPYAPGDLALVPLVLHFAIVFAGETALRGPRIGDVLDYFADDMYRHPLLTLLPTLAVQGVALLALRRR